MSAETAMMYYGRCRHWLEALKTAQQARRTAEANFIESYTKFLLHSGVRIDMMQNPAMNQVRLIGGQPFASNADATSMLRLKHQPKTDPLLRSALWRVRCVTTLEVLR